jgi:hypothetical protein
MQKGVSVDPPTRALPLQHRSPKVLWPEAVQVACQLCDYTPSADQECTLHDLLYGSKPDVARLPVFGCAVSVHIPKKLRHKLAAVSAQRIFKRFFVGYATSSKAWRALANTGYNAWKVIESANVSFEEHIPGIVQPL